MKQRITYLRNHTDDFDPSNRLRVGQDSVTVNSARGAKELRLTFGLSELPTPLALTLRQCHELKIRWAAPEWTPSPHPLFATLSPGLHVFLSPRETSAPTSICSALKYFFSKDLKCTAIEDNFSTPPILSSRFTSSTSHQYYQLVPSLEHLVSYLHKHVCKEDQSCISLASSLTSAASLDVDYDTISQALHVTGLFPESTDGQGWTETVSSSSHGRVEVGVLNQEPATEREELSLSGWLTVIGEDTSPSTTLFSFPSRHHPSSITFTTAFDTPTGLHPTLRLTFPPPTSANPSAFQKPHPSCALHAYFTLPSPIFIDRYAFADAVFLSSHNLAALRAISGATDLEAPDWAVDLWGSAALFELASPDPHATTSWNVTIPMHLRYLAPTLGGYSNTSLPWPVVFWACRADEGTKMSNNPFDRTGLGYDGLFGDRTMFYHATPAASKIIEIVQVPVLDLRYEGVVQWGTVVIIVLGFLWVFWQVFRPLGKRGDQVGKKKKL